MKPFPDPSFRPKSEFLRVLLERGFVHDCTDLAGLDARVSSGVVTAYEGFDLTADSLHVGHLVPIMMLRWLQRTGHRPLVLMGGATTRVGDPSFRDTTRPILSDEAIAANLSGIRRTFERFLRFGDAPTDAVMLDNADWLDGLGYLSFLRDVGRYFSVPRMLSFDSVRQRLEREQSLTLLEFNYMVMQAFDFLELSRSQGCVLQIGASDQWGNMICGVDLARRVDGRELFALTAPLLTTASGAKMGKSAAGAVWLDAGKLPPYGFWQFWRNVDDADVGRFLRLFTELPMDEVVRLEALGGTEVNEAKKVLADEVTTLCHGAEAAEAARETARRTFEDGGSGVGLPSVEIAASSLEAGVPLLDLLVASGLVSTKGEGRRLVRGEGARINDVTISDEAVLVTLRDFQDGVVKLSSGRKRHALVRIA